MKKTVNIFLTCFLCLVLGISIGIILIPKYQIRGDEIESLNYQIVHSKEEAEEFVEGDNYIYKLEAEKDSKEIRYRQVDEIWKVEVEQPGWMIICEYCEYSNDWGFYRNEYELIPSVYYDESKAATVFGRETMFLFASIDGGKYQKRFCYLFYLPKGEYYLNILNDKTNIKAEALIYAAYLPLEDICKVDTIEYNDDFTEATVYFKYITDKWFYGRIAQKHNLSSEAMFNSSYWDTTYIYSSTSTDNEIFDSILHDGIMITKNGDYSIEYTIETGEYAKFAVIVNFTVDKLGDKTKKIEAKSIKLDKTKCTLKVGEKLKLKPIFKPENVTEQKIKWKSSNKKIAVVDKKGKISAKKKGTCVITATTSNGKKAKCKITVKE